jgi:hypothetical protein
MHGEGLGLLTSLVNKVKPNNFNERTSSIQAPAKRGHTPRRGNGVERRQGAPQRAPHSKRETLGL